MILEKGNNFIYLLGGIKYGKESQILFILSFNICFSF